MLKIFYLPYCKYCTSAIKNINTLQKENPDFKNIEIELIDESKMQDLAASYDYYYVPTFYINEQKVHEGKIEEMDIKKILEEASGL